MSACFCIGPQDGQPECPCAMRQVSVVNGRYIRMQDLGPSKRERQSVDDTMKKALKEISDAYRLTNT